MSGHLPECPHSNSRTVTFYGGYCVCPLLRACEQRVLSGPMSMPSYLDGRKRGYAAGVQAARAAVAAIHKPDPYAWTHDDEGNDVDMVGCDRCFDGEYNYDAYPCPTLLAIDALRDDPPSLPPTKGRAHKY